MALQVCVLAVGIAVIHGSAAHAVGTSFTYSSTLTDKNGLPISGAAVTLELTNGNAVATTNTDNNGHFSFTAQQDTYQLLFQITNRTGWPNVVTIYGQSVDLTAGDVAQDLQFPFALPTSPAHTSMTLHAFDVNGNTLSITQSRIATPSFSVPLYSGGPAVNVTTGTTMAFVGGGYSGAFLPGSTFAPGAVCAAFSQGGFACNASSITLGGGDNVVALVRPQSGVTMHTYSGVLTGIGGSPISGVRFTVQLGGGTVDATTDANGSFAFALPAGQYLAHAQGTNIPGYPTTFALRDLNVDLTTGDSTQNYQLTLPVTTVTVQVKDGYGNPASNVYFYGFDGMQTANLGAGAPANTVDSFSSTGTINGSVTVPVFEGTTIAAGAACANFGGTNTFVCNTAAVTVTGTQATVVIALPPVQRTLSGILTDASGAPVSGAVITATSPSTSVSATTDVNGAYVILADPGTYTLSGTLNGLAGLPQSVSFTGLQVDLTNNVTQNLQLPTVHTLTLAAKDASGNAASGVSVVATAQPLTAPLYAGGTATITASNALAQTDVNGASAGIYFEGTTFAAGSICANFGTVIGQVCNTTSVTLSADTSVTLQAPPLAPTNLVAPTPTKNPVLTWSAATGATSYNIYRDGSVIASVTGTSYTDNNASEGTHTYYVTATNGRESAPSNTVSVVVDRTKPVVTVTPLATTLSGTVTFNITVSDNNPLDPNKNKTVWVYMYDVAGVQKHWGAKVNLSSGQGTFTIDTTLLDNGSANLDVGIVYDAAGNASGTSDNYFRGYTISN